MKKRIVGLTLILLLLALSFSFGQTPAYSSGRCCLTWAWSRATGISEDAFYQEAWQLQPGYDCPSSWSSERVAANHGWRVDSIVNHGRFAWGYVVYWAEQGGVVLYALPQWPESYQGPDGLMHAYYCDRINYDPPDYGKFWCYDICNPEGRWWNAQLMRDTWSGWAAGVQR